MIRYEKIPHDVMKRLETVRRMLESDSNIIFAYLFGGLAREAHGPLADLDIALYLKSEDDSSDCRLDLFDRLTEAAGTAELDLVILNSAPVSIAGRVLQNRKLLADKEPFMRHLFESRTLREYFDYSRKEDDILLMRYGIG